MDGWTGGWKTEGTKSTVCCLCHAITAFFQNNKLVCAKHPFCFHFQTGFHWGKCAIVSISLLEVFELKSVQEILKSKFSTEKHPCGKGLCLRSYVCCLPGFTSNPAVLPLPLSAFQLLKLMKC